MSSFGLKKVYEEQAAPYIPVPIVRDLLETLSVLFMDLPKDQVTLLASQLNDPRFIKAVQDDLYDTADKMSK